MIGPCCVLGASAPLVSDSPPDAAAQRGAASDSLPSSDEGFSDGELRLGATAVSYTAQLRCSYSYRHRPLTL